MSFLTPLYIAGIVAVSAPIIFHLIRRTPSGKRPFSTVMFLEPSPPRISKRKRIDNWLLLLLRATALTLLALAFARPFLREAIDDAVDQRASREVAILVDTSASMHREGIWDEAVARVESIVRDAAPGDNLALYTFDSETVPVIGFRESATVPADARQSLFEERLDSIQPSWSATDLGTALATAAEDLEASQTENPSGSNLRKKLVIVISDLQTGSRLDALQRYEWPADVEVRFAKTIPANPTNAGLQRVADNNDLTAGASELRARVRVSNAADSTREQFQLQWESPGASSSDLSKINVYVPPGQSRVVRAPPFPRGAKPSKLTLTGDDHDFDNQVFVEPPLTEQLLVHYYGSEQPDDSSQLRYYVERAFPKSTRRNVEVVGQLTAGPNAAAETGEVHLSIVTEALAEPHVLALREYATNGGTIIVVTRDLDVCATVGELFENADLGPAEADIDGYAMLAEIDFEHPVFSPLSDPRFADFTKIHVWKHRRMALESIPQGRILAKFDNGDTALAELPLGRGRVLVFTSGWHPNDSTFARSSKFVPMLNNILDYGIGRSRTSFSAAVGDPIDLSLVATNFVSDEEFATNVHKPNGQVITLEDGRTTFENADQPGIYVVENPSLSSRFAVNLTPAESRTAPLAVEHLESIGIRLHNSTSEKTKQELEEQKRQLQARELEARQMFWQGIIAATLVVLVLESWVAGRFIRKDTSP